MTKDILQEKKDAPIPHKRGMRGAYSSKFVNIWIESVSQILGLLDSLLLLCRVEEHRYLAHACLILIELLALSIILHYAAIGIIVGTIVALVVRDHEDVMIDRVSEDATWAIWQL